ncbi:alpha/beta hydrolase family protein [Sphingomicrobium aestuariivivum]|uniref:alpha/beta hydrolase family protein n=1 Tax=Sphingomicrobium aestuariivivum TaxID=1582356 RepID=UPI001FD6EE11|nr:S9 family peptidase [Sphingomicrobium aestuariivivum]MCJ8191796.1 S9 family peptidase [Sphingomicrobium aestuariivivum]
MHFTRLSLTLAAALVAVQPLGAQDAAAPDPRFTGADLFKLTIGTSPQISPDGSRIAYVRRANDIMSDGVKSHIWMIDTANGREVALAGGSSPRWSPDGERLAYVASDGDGPPTLMVHWLGTGLSSALTRMAEPPQSMAWSPDGSRIAFTAHVPGEGVTLGKPLSKPEGAEWAEPARITDRVMYRFDGAGYLKTGYTQLFVIDADGGAPRQMTFGDKHHGGALEWMPDGRTILISGNREDDWELDPLDSEIYAVGLDYGTITALTDRDGPDGSPQVSPDGRHIAYLGHDDDKRAYQPSGLWLMGADGSGKRRLLATEDRDFTSLEWTRDGMVVGYQEDGGYRLAEVDPRGDGRLKPLGMTLADAYYSRPYAGGQWSVSDKGRIAFTTGSTMRPSDIALYDGDRVRRLTALNDMFLAGKTLGETKELTVRAADGTPIPTWIVLPPGTPPGTPVPTILEIHGGPYAAYGPWFSSDYQQYAAAGYATVFANPGGSTGYGDAFAQRIEGNYPISNHDELMAAVDAAVAAGYADPDNLFVTGGSGGGILTAWMVGKTDRFAAAASYKPVINWTSMALMSDAIAFFGPYWMKGQPWERPMDYWNRSPLVNMENVTTPTLMIVSDEDYRTPRSEAEQFYGALKLRGVDTALMVTPGASHSDLTMSPSQQAAKTAAVIAWFEKYRTRD